MKKLIVLLLLFSYATLSEGFVSERIFFLLVSKSIRKRLPWSIISFHILFGSGIDILV